MALREQVVDRKNLARLRLPLMIQARVPLLSWVVIVTCRAVVNSVY